MVLREDRDGPLVLLTIDRPERRNALSGEVLDRLVAALEKADEDRDVRVIVLTGAGEKAFCAGADLGGEVAGGDGEGGALARYEALGRIRTLLSAVDRLGTPLVARVNGHALAGGLGIALMCDLVVAADHAEFGTPEVRRGLWPFVISTLIADHLGPKRALELMMTGRRVSAAQALDWGLVNEVVPAADLDAAVGRLVDDLVAGSPVALRLGRRSFVTTRTMGPDAARAHLHAMLDLTVQTEDVAEGLTAFFEKRDPVWPGR